MIRLRSICELNHFLILPRAGKRYRFAATGFLLAVFLVPTLAFVQENPVSRRDGFLSLWQSISRKTEETREVPFVDVPEGSVGFAEITYAKRRGILDDDDPNFHPDAALTLQDALLWLFRTRSIDELENLEVNDLPDMLSSYPIASIEELSRLVTRDELIRLVSGFDQMLRDEEHEVSLYAEKFHGLGTAFGETFDMNALTAAHRTYPHNTLVKVTNVDNGKSVIVRINDRGPYVHGRDMDLSLAAFTSIADRSKGKIMARFERLGDHELVSVCGDAETKNQKRIVRDLHFDRGLPHQLSLGSSVALTANNPFVVRSVTYPDGTIKKLQDFVLTDEKYEFLPSIPGVYAFRFGSIYGRSRIM